MKSATNWRAIACYYFIACAISWPFFFWRDYVTTGYESWFIYIIMWGPGVAALVSMALFRSTHQRTITFFGSSVGRSIAMWFLPSLTATFVFTIGLDSPQKVLIIMLQGATLGFVLTLGEELGWRGFLQDALHDLSPWRRSMVIGVAWALWHFTNNFAVGTLWLILLKAAVYVPVCIAISRLALLMTERTRSLVVACCLHAWLNLSLEMADQMGLRMACALGITLLIWWWLCRDWPAATTHPA